MYNEEIILIKHGGYKMKKTTIQTVFQTSKPKKKTKTISIKKTKEMKRIEKSLSDLFNNTIGKI